MDKLLEVYNVPKLNHEEIGKICRGENIGDIPSSILNDKDFLKVYFMNKYDVKQVEFLNDILNNNVYSEDDEKKFLEFMQHYIRGDIGELTTYASKYSLTEYFY